MKFRLLICLKKNFPRLYKSKNLEIEKNGGIETRKGSLNNDVQLNVFFPSHNNVVSIFCYN